MILALGAQFGKCRQHVLCMDRHVMQPLIGDSEGKIPLARRGGIAYALFLYRIEEKEVTIIRDKTEVTGYDDSSTGDVEMVVDPD